MFIIIIYCFEERTKVYIKTEDILYFESTHNFAKAYTLKKVYSTDKTLKNWSKFFKKEDELFCQINRSILINFRYTIKISKTHLHLTTGIIFVISRRNLRNAKEMLFHCKCLRDTGILEIVDNEKV